MSRARRLLADALVWDHGCLPIRPLDETFFPQLGRYRASGVDHVSLNIGSGAMGVDEHVRMLASLRRWIKRHPEEYLLVHSVGSHSNPAGVHAHPRNISDELMLACAASGGVVGINGVGPFLGDNDTRSETVVRHVDYAVQLIGPAHVALGLDYVFDQVEIDQWIESRRDTFPAGLGYERGLSFVKPEQLEDIVEGLMRKGYQEADLRNILGLNLFRVATLCWKD